MAIVIHELEVIPEEKPAAGGAAAAGRAAPAPAERPRSVGTLDIHRVLRHERERSLRVWAH